MADGMRQQKPTLKFIQSQRGIEWRDQSHIEFSTARDVNRITFNSGTGKCPCDVLQIICINYD